MCGSFKPSLNNNPLKGVVKTLSKKSAIKKRFIAYFRACF
ncbi:hypothetical protein HPHPA9_0636 [Helicobacter pylori Hp A-9]|uniref:Uncharacterized protein n=1 Tax=Helicobacter pylori Hp A-9 TaxID=992034 RepID=I9RIM7_HELPX|nr:hypothetical protein HPHPA9_0636 [Helicobacter pylori Hp A-9]